MSLTEAGGPEARPETVADSVTITDSITSRGPVNFSFSNTINLLQTVYAKTPSVEMDVSDSVIVTPTIISWARCT